MATENAPKQFFSLTPQRLPPTPTRSSQLPQSSTPESPRFTNSTFPKVNASGPANSGLQVHVQKRRNGRKAQRNRNTQIIGTSDGGPEFFRNGLFWNIVNSDLEVKSGTLDALIERLTSHDELDQTFFRTFLLTFKSFTTSEIFLEKLIERYSP
jgi:hypothetical protein